MSYRTSLVVQRLRLLAPNAGEGTRSLVRERDPTCYNQGFSCHNQDPMQPNKYMLKKKKTMEEEEWARKGRPWAVGHSNQHKCTVSTHNPDCLLPSRRWVGAYFCQEEGQSLWLFPIYSSHAHNHSLKVTFFFLISQIFPRCFLSQSSFTCFQDAQHWLSYGLQPSQYFTGAGAVCHACFQLECTA